MCTPAMSHMHCRSLCPCLNPRISNHMLDTHLMEKCYELVIHTYHLQMPARVEEISRSLDDARANFLFAIQCWARAILGIFHEVFADEKRLFAIGFRLILIGTAFIGLVLLFAFLVGPYFLPTYPARVFRYWFWIVGSWRIARCHLHKFLLNRARTQLRNPGQRQKGHSRTNHPSRSAGNRMNHQLFHQLSHSPSPFFYLQEWD